jgi:hypothetical protein
MKKEQTLGDCPSTEAAKKPGLIFSTSFAHWALEVKMCVRLDMLEDEE